MPRRIRVKLSTRSRYGTRMMIELARHYNQGPLQINDIAKKQDISVKYLEQLIIPLKKANYIKSIRGSKGGYILARSPEEITIGEIVAILEGGLCLTSCIKDPKSCIKFDTCPTRKVWERVSKAIYEELNAISLHDML